MEEIAVCKACQSANGDGTDPVLVLIGRMGTQTQYDDGNSNAWIKNDELYQCPECKAVQII